MQESKDSLLAYADVSEELANRIINRMDEYLNFEQFCNLLKTKELTYARISRAMIHILLNIKADSYYDISYARVLGFHKAQADILTTMNRNTSIPLITKLTAYSDMKELQIDIKSSDLYNAVITDKYQTAFQSEYTKQIILFR